MPAFTDKLDIANRALQSLRRHRITSFTNSSQEAREIAATFDRLREAELEAHLWRFSTRRAVLRGVTTSTKLWTPPAYAAGTTYAEGKIVTYGGEWWQSKVASNLANTPDAGNYWRRYFGPDSLLAWDTDTTYNAGDLVSYSSAYYLSLENSNDDATTETSWLAVLGTVVDLKILYPLGTGPLSDSTTRNIFRLPRGFLRLAPTDPKADAYQAMGVRSGLQREDWVVENGYIISANPGPLPIRFVANLIDVFEWDALFCEMLAASLADELAPQLIEEGRSLSSLINNTRRLYREKRRRAIATNCIEIGPVARYIDDLILARM